MSSKLTRRMRFHVGDVVEVDSSHEEGFYGSYWEATILSTKISTNEYLVEYNEIYEDDDFSAKLQQVVPSHIVRPIPPKCPVQRYKFGDRVDVFEKDGWWVGTVGGVYGDEESYYVYFDAFKVGVTYPVSEIRMHQDWHKGKWSTTSIWA